MKADREDTSHLCTRDIRHLLRVDDDRAAPHSLLIQHDTQKDTVVLVLPICAWKKISSEGVCPDFLHTSSSV